MFQKYIKSYTNNFGEVTDTRNYRPINIISSFIKEQLIYNRLDLFLKKKFHVNTNVAQCGFRKGYSTEQAIYDIMENLHSAIDNKQISCS